LHGLARPFLSSMFWQFLGPLKHEIWWPECNRTRPMSFADRQ
jgi:hypothetical protein